MNDKPMLEPTSKAAVSYAQFCVYELEYLVVTGFIELAMDQRTGYRPGAECFHDAFEARQCSGPLLGGLRCRQEN